jgi:hypothetical protein
VSSTRVDTESVQRVPERVHVHFTHTLHHSARHRTLTHATPSPSTPTHRRGLLVTETVHHWTETDLASVDTAHARAPRLHHWTQSTMPSPASRPDRRIISDESTLNRDHPEHINLEHPSPCPLCLPFAPFPHLLSSVSSSLCITRSRSSQQALASSPEKHRSRGRRGRLPSDFIAAILSFLPCWLPRPRLNLTLYFSCPRSTGSRRHRRPRRSAWEQWRCIRSKLRPVHFSDDVIKHLRHPAANPCCRIIADEP